MQGVCQNAVVLLRMLRERRCRVEASGRGIQQWSRLCRGEVVSVCVSENCGWILSGKLVK